MIFWSNCLWFAIKKYRKHGGYIFMRRSKYGSWLPHFGWSRKLNDAEIEHFVPEDKIPMRIPPPWFRGYVKYEDD